MRFMMMNVLFLMFTTGVSPASAATATVPQWGRFEAAVTNDTAYHDPYRDVTLNVVYTRPDGTTVRFWGFYDGGHRWRMRMMADQVGQWRYEATFSDGKSGVSGTFACVASDLPGMISADRDNPMWFGFSSGKHGLVRAFHIGDRFFAANWPEAKRKAFLDWVVKNKYNTLSIASHYLNRDAEDRGRGWETPKLWPLNAGEYGKMEALLDDLAARRICVFPFAGFFGQSSNYPQDPADQELYIRYTLARIGPYWNVMFNVAGPEPNLHEGWMKDEEVERLGRLIKRLDPFNHLLSVHNETGDDPYRDSEWSAYGILQGPKTRDRAELSRGLLRNHSDRKPLLAQETLWSGNTYHIRKNNGDYSDSDLRKNAIVIHMSAAAFVFADNDGNSSSGFSGTLELGACKQSRHDIIGRVWDFFATIPYYRMRPRQDLVDGGYCLADEGSSYLVYLESGGKVNVKVGAGEYTVKWIDASSTQDVQEAGTMRQGQELASPNGGDDWFALLERVVAKQKPRAD